MHQTQTWRHHCHVTSREKIRRKVPLYSMVMTAAHVWLRHANCVQDKQTELQDEALYAMQEVYRVAQKSRVQI